MALYGHSRTLPIQSFNKLTTQLLHRPEEEGSLVCIFERPLSAEKRFRELAILWQLYDATKTKSTILE